MAAKHDFPFILSPNLGCPHLWSLEEVRDSVSMVLALSCRECSASPEHLLSTIRLSLKPSFPDRGPSRPIPLAVVGEPMEIPDWDTLPGRLDVDATRKRINKMLHYDVLNGGGRYWSVEVKIDFQGKRFIRSRFLERERNSGKWLPTLFDLVLRDEASGFECVNHHAVQFVETFERECCFVHLTDLHLARRNDEILEEVLSVKTERSPSQITYSYVNFNNNFRKFVKAANDMRRNSELHFIVITGDIVDFAFCGWEPSANEAENNWKTFIEIVLGKRERADGKDIPGLKVAIFTSTGNHDWRKWPYDPLWLKYYDIYGLEKNEIKNYSYRSFDALVHGKERENLEEQMFQDLSKTYNRGALKYLAKFRGWFYRLSKWMNELLKSPSALATAAVAIGLAGWKLFDCVLLWALAVIPLFFEWLADKFCKRMIRLAVDFPLYADSMAIEYYLKQINPYLDYAFRWGEHLFVVMDSGSDVFTGKFLDEKDASNIKKMSVWDHILGGSPDSRGFDSAHLYYNWSQIVWLEKVLTALRPPRGPNSPEEEDEAKRTFIFVHAPPLNVEDSIQSVMKHFWESARGRKKWVRRWECDLTYGTLNHYVSQFLYMCLGYKESVVPYNRAKRLCREVDIVFSGHAHRNIEFRGKIEFGERRSCQDEIRIYCDKYNEIFEEQPIGSQPDWWKDHRPLFVQTAACGLKGKDETCPPYFRKVRLNEHGNVTTFEICNLREVRARFPRQLGCLELWLRSDRFCRFCIWFYSISCRLSRLLKDFGCSIVKFVRRIWHGLRTCRLKTWITIIFIVVSIVLCMHPGMRHEVAALMTKLQTELREAMGFITALATKLQEVIRAICK